MLCGLTLCSTLPLAVTAVLLFIGVAERMAQHVTRGTVLGSRQAFVAVWSGGYHALGHTVVRAVLWCYDVLPVWSEAS